MSDFHQFKAWFGREKAKACVEALRRNGFDAEYTCDKTAALKAVLSLVPAGASVGIGGSVTLRELGLPRALKSAGHTVFDHWDETLSPSEREAVRNAQPTADVFLSGTNAVTKQGALVNVDGTGNRVAAMIFGPATTVIVTGYNKIVEDIPQAFSRIKDYVAPVNFKRLNKETPCQTGGTCSDCDNPRACRVTTIIEAPPTGKKEFWVIVVGEELGF